MSNWQDLMDERFGENWIGRQYSRIDLTNAICEINQKDARIKELEKDCKSLLITAKTLYFTLEEFPSEDEEDQVWLCEVRIKLKEYQNKYPKE